MFRNILVVLALLACAGCAAPMVIVPDAIGSRGLLVGEVCRIDGEAVPYADPFIDKGDTGKQYLFGMRQEYLTVPLAPGQYSIRHLNEMVYSSNIYTRYNIYPIGVGADIVAGQATSIGLLLLDPKPPAALPAGTATAGYSSPRYRVVALDNSTEMAMLLRDSRPQLFQSLRADQPMAASKASASSESIAQARKTIISNRFERDLRQGRAPSEYVTGCAGTVGRMTVGHNGQAAFKTLETHTLANLSACNAAGERLVCLISRDKYVSVTGDRVTQEQLPTGMNANSLHAVSNDRLVLIDDSMNVYSSSDNGATWSKSTGAAFAEPLGRDSLADPKQRFGVHLGAQSFYLFGREMDEAHTRVLRGDYRTGELVNLNVPKAEYLSSIRETQAGLFVAPRWAFFAKAKMQFLPSGSNAWRQIETPSSSCHDLAFADDSGANVQVLCEDDNVWNSKDGGASWQRMFRANSLFALP
jgi:hypothetical protein